MISELAFMALVAAAIGAAGSFPIMLLLWRIGSRQTIDPFAPETHRKKQGTPTMGGLIVLIGAFGALYALPTTLSGPFRLHLAFFAIGFTLIGFVDDYLIRLITGRRGLGWIAKLIPQCILAAYGAWILGSPNLETTLTVAFVILFLCNAYNFADGLDGLAGSIAIAYLLGIIVLSMDFGQWQPIVAIALIGGLIPFLFWNAPPARVFMGDTGSMPIGALFGLMVASMLPHNIDGGIALTAVGKSLAIPLLIVNLLLIAELVPVPMQVGWYKITKKRLFPMTPIHHGFEKIGWPESRVVWSFALVQLLLSVAAVASMRLVML